MKKYIIKKGKEDLLSSLKALNKDLLKEKMKEYEVSNILELKDAILDDFTFCLETSSDDPFTRMYFAKILENENSRWMSAYKMDIESLYFFVYDNDNYLSYYIPTEIKKIIENIFQEENTMDEFNPDNIIKKREGRSLKAQLKERSTSELETLCNSLQINVLHKNKKDLIDIVYGALTDKKSLTNIIKNFIRYEFDLLKNIINNNGTIIAENLEINVCSFLDATGIIFIYEENNVLYVSITDDVYNVIKGIDLSKLEKTIDENTKVYNLISALIELYGVVSYDEVKYFYNLYYGENKKLEKEIDKVLFASRICMVDSAVIDNNIYFVNLLINLDEYKHILHDVIKNKKDLKKKEFELDKLLKFNDPSSNFNTKSYMDLENYLNEISPSLEISKPAYIFICKTIRFDYNLEELIQFLKIQGVDCSGKKEDKLKKLIDAVYEDTILFVNNGWTIKEIKEMNS